MDLNIPELNEIIKEIAALKSELKRENENNDLSAEWYNDEQCWEKKGGMALSTYRTNRYYQIKGGIPDAYVGGRKVWKKESLLEWLQITDDQLDEYHRKYKTGARKKA